MSEAPHALVERDGPVLIVTMNRPEARNALSPDMLRIMSEARWGLYPLGGSAVRLPRQVPYTVAADILLTGRHLTAAEALAIGLVGHVVPDGTALDKARELAGLVAANGPLAVQAVLRTLRETDCLPEAEAFQIDARLGTQVFMTDDAKEGPRAFKEKRTPTFQGR